MVGVGRPHDGEVRHHVHADPVISLVLEGDGVEDVAGRTRPVTAQDLLLTPAYALHGYRFGRSGRWFNMTTTDSARMTVPSTD